MLHLAEVKKQPRGIIGGLKSELKLLARQEKDQTWIPIPGEETVVCDYVNNLGEGALVLVNLGGNRQIQGPLELAGAKLVRQLQNFSRLLEKNKTEDERIEMWKQSLTAQAEVLNQREEEISLLYEQMEAKEKEFEDLDRQRQEIEERWASLKEEQQKLEQVKQRQLLVLNEQQSTKIKELTTQFSRDVENTNVLKENLNKILEIFKTKQENLDNHSRQLEQYQQQLETKTKEIENLGEQLKNRKQQLESAQKEFEKAEKDWQIEKILLKNKQEYLLRIGEQLQGINQLQNELNRIESGEVSGDMVMDVEYLENMPLGDLQKEVARLEIDLKKDVNFVNEQEDELKYHSTVVSDLQQKIKVANQDERLALEGDLADAQESKRMLDETLQGQRPKLRKKRQILIQYLRVLKRRQGDIELETGQDKINLEPLQLQLESQQSLLEQQKQKLEADIDHMGQNLQKTAEWLQQQQNGYKLQEVEIQNQEESWLEGKLELKALQSRVQIHEEVLQPIQNFLNQMREKLHSMETLLNQVQEGDQEKNRFGFELQEILSNLLTN